MQTIKIDIYSSAISRKNGGSSSMVDLSKALISAGYDITIYTRLGRLDEYVYRVNDFHHFDKVKVNTSHKLRATPTIIKIIQLISRRNTYRIPDIILDGELMNIERMFYPKKPFFILNHAGSIEAFNSFIKNFNTSYFDFIRHYDGLLFQSKEQKEEVAGLIEIKKAFFQLYPSVSESQLDQFKNKGNPFDQQFNIVQIGTISDRKNQIETLRIARIIQTINSKIHFHLIGPIGDQTYYEKFITQKENLGLKNITYWGFRSDYPRFLNHCDIVLQVSKSEGISRIIREAYYFQKPVFSYDIKGCQEVIKDSENGKLIDFNDYKSLADAIDYYCSHKKELKILGNNAFAFYQSNFSEETYKERVQDLFKKIYEK